MKPSRERRGTTLIELMVVLALLGIAFSVVTLAVRRMAPAVDDMRASIAAARKRAATSGVPVHVARIEAVGAADFTAYPDGHVVADSGVAVNMLSGRSP